MSRRNAPAQRRRRSPLTIAVALTCAAGLLLQSTPATASGRTLSQAVRAVTGDPELPEQANIHLGKAYDHFNAGSYDQAESEFKRAAFFAPDWTPMTYNLAVVAEAQGHLGEAIDRYEAYRPNAEGDTGLIVDQRITELEDRIVRIKKADRRQLILGTVAVSTGALALGGGVGLFLLRNKRNDEIDDIEAMLAIAEGEGGPDAATRDQLTADKADKTESAKNLYIGGYILAVYGGLALLYSGLYLASAIKKRKAKKLALRPTGSGVAIAF